MGVNVSCECPVAVVVWAVLCDRSVHGTGLTAELTEITVLDGGGALVALELVVELKDKDVDDMGVTKAEVVDGVTEASCVNF